MLKMLAKSRLWVILGLYWDNAKENGNYYSILGLYRDNIGGPASFLQQSKSLCNSSRQSLSVTACSMPYRSSFLSQKVAKV